MARTARVRASFSARSSGPGRLRFTPLRSDYRSHRSTNFRQMRPAARRCNASRMSARRYQTASRRKRANQASGRPAKCSSEDGYPVPAGDDAAARRARRGGGPWDIPPAVDGRDGDVRGEAARGRGPPRPRNVTQRTGPAPGRCLQPQPPYQARISGVRLSTGQASVTCVHARDRRLHCRSVLPCAGNRRGRGEAKGVAVPRR